MKFVWMLAIIALLQTVAQSEEVPSVFREALKQKLVIMKDQEVAAHEIEKEPKYYVFYFSAHWCPPCRAFTPSLVEFYNEHPGKGKEFEIIFVSDDKDARAMVTYMKEMEMPWPAVGYAMGPRLWDVRKYRGRGIPCLVVVDHQGKVLSDSYRNGQYVGPGVVLQELQVMLEKER
jgi:nucleoredoxin